MKREVIGWCMCIGVVLAGGSATSLAEEVWAVDSGTDSLYVIETDTGVVVRTVGRLHPDPARFTTPVAMAVRPADGMIFVSNNSPTMDNGLATVDPNTGLATFIGGASIDGALSFDKGGKLYTDGGAAGLLTVDTSTGATTPVGGPGLPRLFGLDYNPGDGHLYGITSTAPGAVPTLLKIDPATGAIAATVTLSTAISGVPGTLLFERSGKLVASNTVKELFDINPATGGVTNVRSAAEGPQGMGLVAVPAPQTPPCHWWQPWNKRRPTYESRVWACQQPSPKSKIALDDFICCDPTKIKQIHWWGWLSGTVQATRPFYIAIYLDTGNCAPMTSPVYRTCVVPSYIQYAGLDCQNRMIFRLAATLPVAFNAAGGQRYWLQISEADAESFKVDAEDFRWAAHRPCEEPVCWAVEGVPFKPLPPDACDQKRNELAFALNSRGIHVSVPVPPTAQPIPFSYLLVQGGAVQEMGVLLLDSTGNGKINPEVEDGEYELILYTTGGAALRETIRLLDGEEAEAQFPPLCIADVNLDGKINFADINPFVQCLTQSP